MTLAAMSWFTSTFAPTYGMHGMHIPEGEFVREFMARWVHPNIRLHAMARFNKLTQGDLTIKAFNEKFNASAYALHHVPELVPPTAIELRRK